LPGVFGEPARSHEEHECPDYDVPDDDVEGSTMAAATREKDMASDLIATGADEPDDRKPQAPEPSQKPDQGGGFFHIYKSGQGYWTRMCTVGAAALLAALFANFLYNNLYIWIQSAGVAVGTAKTTSLYVIAGFIAVYALIVFWLMNKPTNADFLIATDSEMKKVNWTSRRELMGSTKVVIIFMFLIAAMLFEFDLIFGELFYYCRVLKTGPLPDSPELWWVRWGFWGLVLAEIAGILLLMAKARADHRR
jgi:preprotein translocase subunit SecE